MRNAKRHPSLLIFEVHGKSTRVINKQPITSFARICFFFFFFGLKWQEGNSAWPSAYKDLCVHEIDASQTNRNGPTAALFLKIHRSLLMMQ